MRGKNGQTLNFRSPSTSPRCQTELVIIKWGQVDISCNGCDCLLPIYEPWSQHFRNYLGNIRLAFLLLTIDLESFCIVTNSRVQIWNGKKFTIAVENLELCFKAVANQSFWWMWEVWTCVVKVLVWDIRVSDRRRETYKEVNIP